MSETKNITERPDGKEGIGELWRRWKRRFFTNNPANLAGAALDARRAEALLQEVEKYGGTSFGIDQGVSVLEHQESIHVKVRRGKTVSHGSDDLRITSRQLETKPRSNSNLEYAGPSVFRNEHSNAVDLHEKTLDSAKDGVVKDTDPRSCSSESLGQICDTSPDKPSSYLGDANIFVKGSTCETSATSSLSSSPCIVVEESDRAGLASSSPNIQPTGALVLGRDVETEKPDMNFRHQITQLRNRRGQGTKLDAKAASSAEDDEWADIPSMDVVSMASSSTDETASGSSHGKATSKSSLEDSASVNVQEEEEELHAKSSEKEWSNDQKGVYEMQLENLQEQLVDIMIENQTLAQKLQKYENSDIIPLLKKLEEERAANESLTKRCETLEDHMKRNRPMHQISVDSESSVSVQSPRSASFSSPPDDVDGPPPTRWERFQNNILDKFFTLMADFTEEGEESDTDAPTEGDELTVKKLKENLKRFQAGYEPGLLFCKAMSALVSWKSTSNTFLAFVIYMYVVWRGWSATVLIGLLLWYLTTTYFISRGWTIQFSFLPYHLVEVTQDERPPLSMSDRFQLVLHVSRRVQNILGSLADQMEKIQNFLYWTNPDLTKSLYTNLVIAFVTSLFISGSMLLTLIGLFLGVKVFLINPVLKKYPRLKAKYSFEEKIFRVVPTAAQLEQRRAIEETQQFLVPDIEGITVRFNGEETQDSEPASKRFKAFAETFNVPESEQPLAGWKEGKRCTLITKNTVTGAFKNGRLYLTKSFLCFEKSSLSKDGNMLIPLKEIIRIEKAKPFNFMPGSGMSIEIHMASADKPVLFGGMLRRNLIYDQLMEVWQAAQRAIQHRSSASNMEAMPSTSQGDVRSRAGSHRQASASHSEAGESDSESAC